MRQRVRLRRGEMRSVGLPTEKQVFCNVSFFQTLII